MSYKDAAVYIKAQRKEGRPDEAIVTTLKGAGWHDADINLAFQMENQIVPNGQGSSEPENGAATASLVLGIVGMLMAALTIVPIIGVIYGIIAVRKPGHRTKAVWGLTLSSVAVVLGFVTWIFIGFGMFAEIMDRGHFMRDDSYRGYDTHMDEYYDESDYSGDFEGRDYSDYSEEDYE